jgi:FlaA1/EpsC-like NDP-sugar epimerase
MMSSAPLRRLAMFGLDVSAFVFAGVLAFLLRFEFMIPRVHLAHLAYGVAVWAIVKSLVFWRCQLHRGGWRYVSINEVFVLGLANLAGSCLAAAAIRAVAPRGFPRSIYLIDFFLCVIATATSFCESLMYPVPAS